MLSYRETKLTSLSMVDIYQYPIRIVTHPNGSRVALGDMDGNCIKLLHFLITESAITFPQGQYKEFIRIYQAGTPKENTNEYHPRLTAEDLALFHTLLTKIDRTKSAPTLLLIGDDLSDRGSNDYFTLKLYERLAQLEINYEILASNHGLDFLEQFFSDGGISGKAISHFLTHEPDNGFGINYFAHSLIALREGIANKLISETEVNSLVMNYVIPQLKLIQFDREKNDLILYSHSPLQPKLLPLIFDWLRKLVNLPNTVVFEANNLDNLTTSLQHINIWFQYLLGSKTRANELLNHPMLNGFVDHRYEAITAPPVPMGPYTVTNVHGHVGEKPIDSKLISSTWRYHNLDVACGKKAPYAPAIKMYGQDNNIGKYKTLTAVKKTLKRSASYSSFSFLNDNDNSYIDISCAETLNMEEDNIKEVSGKRVKLS